MSKKRIQFFQNQNINDWTIVDPNPFTKGNTTHLFVKVKCKCGNIHNVTSSKLIANKSRMCVDCSNINNRKYKEKYARLYGIWSGIKSRCYNKKYKDYPRYGAKGIILCEMWKNNFETFQEWSLNNGYKDNLVLDRKDSSLNYEPNNCRWVTQHQNVLNRSKNDNSNFKYKGLTKCGNKIQSNITYNNKCHNLGVYTDENQAAIAYNKAARELHGEFANYNIIDPKISFGIITTDQGRRYLEYVIDSIYKLNIPNDSFEIIVVGGSQISGENLTYVEFDESIKPGWVTRKNNICNELAKYPNVINARDYMSYEPDFYNGFVKFNQEFPDWEICMAKIVNTDNTRYRDWVIFDSPKYGKSWICTEPWCPHGGLFMPGSPVMPNYKYKDTHDMYLSGGWQMTRRYVMEQNPWDENLLYSHGDDVFWSRQVLKHNPPKYNYVMNTYSTVKLARYKDKIFNVNEAIT